MHWGLDPILSSIIDRGDSDTCSAQAREGPEAMAAVADHITIKLIPRVQYRLTFFLHCLLRGLYEPT